MEGRRVPFPDLQLRVSSAADEAGRDADGNTKLSVVAVVHPDAHAASFMLLLALCAVPHGGVRANRVWLVVPGEGGGRFPTFLPDLNTPHEQPLLVHFRPTVEGKPRFEVARPQRTALEVRAPVGGDDAIESLFPLLLDWLRKERADGFDHLILQTVAPTFRGRHLAMLMRLLDELFGDRPWNKRSSIAFSAPGIADAIPSPRLPVPRDD